MNLTPATIAGILLIGLLAGMMSSMVGLGGGLIVVPGLVLLFAMSQKMAQGTSLAMMLPPIGILAVVNYHKQGYVDFKIAAILCISFVIGGFLGSKIVLGLEDAIVKKVFAVFMIIIAVKYLFFDK